MWIVWTGGDDRFWDKVTQNSLATFDLLKVITSHPSQTYCDGRRCDRDSRWKWLGAVNEPCFEEPSAPDPAHFGLWLDHRSAGCAPDPFENATNYPGVKIGQRGQAFKDGTTLPVGSYFGEATGILGLRLFPNPEFDEAAKARWDPGAITTITNITRPEARPAVSCRYVLRLLSCRSEPDLSAGRRVASRIFQPEFDGRWTISVDGSRLRVVGGREEFRLPTRPFLPTGDDGTSLVSTDYINNPRTMNAVYLLGERLRQAHIWGKERLEGNERLEWAASWRVRSSRDFVVAARAQGGRGFGRRAGALNRVYINIGLYSEDWMTHFNPFFGLSRSPLFSFRPPRNIPLTGARPRRARRRWPLSWSPRASRTNSPTRRGAVNISTRTQTR